ncbi:uncharacterized protein CEXT_295791 [Caerostris extrusa]|uniref:Thyroglobulin type-1 domain-containing protein n=1 Tax=Caerostris extrusa TaxID=172846 RepID=A0AAV4RQ53_CAEEX|nr:uncharacterized protein CEXT_295791 [Caerostris extrusa]
MMSFRTVVLLSSFGIILQNALCISLQERLRCSKEFCNSVVCEPLTECFKGRIVPNATYCGCCSACVITLNENEKCIAPVPGSLRDIKVPECKAGLKCIQGKCSPVTDSMPPCLLLRKTIKSKSGEENYADNLWIPECDEDGTFKATQRRKKKQKVLCYDKQGNKIFGQAAPHTKSMTCGVGTGDLRLPPLLRTMGELLDYIFKVPIQIRKLLVRLIMSSRNRAFPNSEFQHAIHKGVPRYLENLKIKNPLTFNIHRQEHCSATGNFDQIQCIKDICFCAHPVTGQVEGRVVKSHYISKLPCYKKEITEKDIQKACEKELQRIQSLLYFFHLKGVEISGLEKLQCDLDGTFSSRQCDTKRNVTFNEDLKVKFIKHEEHPELLRQLVLEIMNNISPRPWFIYTDGSKSDSGRTGSGIFMKTSTGEFRYRFRNPDHSSVFRSELTVISEALSLALDFKVPDVWILTDNKKGVGIESYFIGAEDYDKLGQVGIKMTCNCARDVGSASWQSQYPILKCKGYGNYSPLQCFDNEECFCVDTDGEVISEYLNKTEVDEPFCNNMLHNLIVPSETSANNIQY